MVIRFGLEANVIKFARKDFDEITSACIPGPSTDLAKAEKLRRFPAPDHLRSAYSSTSTRSFTIFAAVVCDDDVWAILDFGRIVQLHIISRNKIWTKADFKIGSKVSFMLFVYNYTSYTTFNDLEIYLDLLCRLRAGLDRWNSAVS